MTRQEADPASKGTRGPLPCQWYDDGEGGRYLIPGCMTRVINPDIDRCSCKTVEEQLENARAEIEKLERGQKGLQAWHDHIVRAVYDHPDGVHIMKKAADRACTSEKERR